MKTFQIYRTISQEFFVEAESDAEAIRMIDEALISPYDTTELSLTITDTHDGMVWESEKEAAAE